MAKKIRKHIHVPCSILLRSKNDSYYVTRSICGDPGDDGLIAIWDEELPAWGLDALATQMLHESFARLNYAHLLSHAVRKRKPRRK